MMKRRDLLKVIGLGAVVAPAVVLGKTDNPIKCVDLADTNYDVGLLDDYEQGSFTPNGAGVISGRYMRMGNIVHFNIKGVQPSTKMFIKGLPFKDY